MTSLGLMTKLFTIRTFSNIFLGILIFTLEIHCWQIMHFTNAAKNPHFNVIFVEFYEEQKKKKLVSTIIPYLELFHQFGFNVPIFVEDNPFGTIRNIIEDDVKYKTLFEKCINKCNVSFYKNTLKSIISSQNFPFFSFSIFGQSNEPIC